MIGRPPILRQSSAARARAIYFLFCSVICFCYLFSGGCYRNGSNGVTFPVPVTLLALGVCRIAIALVLATGPVVRLKPAIVSTIKQLGRDEFRNDCGGALNWRAQFHRDRLDFRKDAAVGRGHTHQVEPGAVRAIAQKDQLRIVDGFVICPPPSPTHAASATL